MNPNVFEKRKRYGDEIDFVTRKSQACSQEIEDRITKGYTQSAVNEKLRDQMSEELSTLLLLRQTIDQRIRELQRRIYSTTL